ncbi:murein biosynthesis integral membrane protein MurJ, partial [Verrucomicrobia bacterium]|nr:murein biosynthesis integral membrane protein MurJ [Verrucomicrobiota bacterium]
MALATLFSRILGMCRVMVYARFMGDSMVASAFVFAFQVPNLFRRLLGEGALSAALVPILKEKEVKEGDKGMWDTANAALSLLVCVCAVAVVLLIAGC